MRSAGRQRSERDSMPVLVGSLAKSACPHDCSSAGSFEAPALANGRIGRITGHATTASPWTGVRHGRALCLSGSSNPTANSTSSAMEEDGVDLRPNVSFNSTFSDPDRDRQGGGPVLRMPPAAAAKLGIGALARHRQPPRRDGPQSRARCRPRAINTLIGHPNGAAAFHDTAVWMRVGLD